MPQKKQATNRLLSRSFTVVIDGYLVRWLFDLLDKRFLLVGKCLLSFRR